MKKVVTIDENTVTISIAEKALREDCCILVARKISEKDFIEMETYVLTLIPSDKPKCSGFVFYWANVFPFSDKISATFTSVGAAIRYLSEDKHDDYSVFLLNDINELSEF